MTTDERAETARALRSMRERLTLGSPSADLFCIALAGETRGRADVYVRALAAIDAVVPFQPAGRTMGALVDAAVRHLEGGAEGA